MHFIALNWAAEASVGIGNHLKLIELGRFPALFPQDGWRCVFKPGTQRRLNF
jgi:hypothetical protein